MSVPIRTAPWRPSAHAVVTGAVSAVLATLAVVGHRPDLLVVAVPLLLAVGPGLLLRPAHPTETVVGLRSDRVAEGSSTTVSVDVRHDPAADALGLDLAPDRRTVAQDDGAVSQAVAPGDRTALELLVSPSVWGSHRIATGELRLSTAWGVWTSRYPRLADLEITATPSPVRLQSRGDDLPPAHLIGRHVSRRPGDGAEFAEIRGFRPGDRIRHIHWPTSARTGELHVRTTFAERDAQVVLLLDVLSDIPDADPRHPSSVERAVQAAAHVAGHVATAGDRVGLRVVGDVSVPVPAASGRGHLQRLLGVLARVRPAVERQPDIQRLSLGLEPGSTVVALTPLTSRVVVDALAGLARRRLEVVVIDVCPDRTVQVEAVDDIAWRLLQLERSRTAELLEHEGIPVVPWDDAGAVEQALLRLRVRRQGVRA